MIPKERRVVSDAEVLSVFTPQPANWAVQSWVIDWTGLPARESILETAVHRTDMDGARPEQSRRDALNRPTSVTLPADAVGTRSVLEPSYNRAGAVEALFPSTGSGRALTAPPFHHRYNFAVLATSPTTPGASASWPPTATAS